MDLEHNCRGVRCVHFRCAGNLLLFATQKMLRALAAEGSVPWSFTTPTKVTDAFHRAEHALRHVDGVPLCLVQEQPPTSTPEQVIEPEPETSSLPGLVADASYSPRAYSPAGSDWDKKSEGSGDHDDEGIDWRSMDLYSPFSPSSDDPERGVSPPIGDFTKESVTYIDDVIHFVQDKPVDRDERRDNTSDLSSGGDQDESDLSTEDWHEVAPRRRGRPRLRPADSSTPMSTSSGSFEVLRSLSEDTATDNTGRNSGSSSSPDSTSP